MLDGKRICACRSASRMINCCPVWCRSRSAGGNDRRVEGPAVPPTLGNAPRCYTQVTTGKSRPVGALDNSPAIYRWGRKEKASASPVGTTEDPLAGHPFGRPYGTTDDPFSPVHPAVNCWAIFQRPYGTKSRSDYVCDNKGVAQGWENQCPFGAAWSLTSFPLPLDVAGDLRMGQQLLLGVVAAAQFLFVGNQVVDGRVAGLAEVHPFLHLPPRVPVF